MAKQGITWTNETRTLRDLIPWSRNPRVCSCITPAKALYCMCNSPEYVRMAAHNRRVKKQENGGSYTVSEWEALCEKYGNKCLACNRTDALLTVDHVIPISRGGSNDISNLQPLCKSCNSRKHNKSIDYR